MSDLERPTDDRPADPARLDSWKEIAAYLKRHVTTVRRWEKQEGLPVHRHVHDKLGSVYAFPGEIDDWWRSRRLSLEAPEDTQDSWQDLAAPARHTDAAESPEEAAADVVGGGNGARELAVASTDAPNDPQTRLSGFSETSEIEGVRSGELDRRRFEAPNPAATRRSVVTAGVAIGALVAGAIVAGVIAWGRNAADPELRIARFVLPIELGQVAPGDLAVSPNGAYVAYASTRSGTHTLYLRDLADSDGKPVTTVEGGHHPFFSPDSQWLGFFADGKLRKVSVQGGSAVTLADATSGRQATWTTDDSIVYAPSGRAGLFQVSASGGPAKPITSPDADNMETSHAEPYWLPGGHAVLFVARGATLTTSTLMALVPGRGASRAVLVDAHQPAYVDSHLLYLTDGQLMAVPFDRDRNMVLGAPRAMLDEVAADAISTDGTLIYAPRVDTGSKRRLVWVNRQGVSEPVNAPTKDYANLRLSPDGTRVALSMDVGADANIGIYDFVRGVLTRLTFEGRNLWPIWSHDGRHVIYGSNRVETTWDVYSKSADGYGKEEALVVKPLLQIPQSLSGNGQLLAVGEWGPTEFGISVYGMGDRQVKAAFPNATSGALSPDGRWIAYTSNDSGRYEIYVRPTTGDDGKWMVSDEGGREPLWARSGQELFYRHRNEVLAVEIDTVAGLSHGKPRVLFDGPYSRFDQNLDGLMYDAAPDGQRFLMLQDVQEPSTDRLQVVVNWTEELRRTAASPQSAIANSSGQSRATGSSR